MAFGLFCLIYFDLRIKKKKKKYMFSMHCNGPIHDDDGFVKIFNIWNTSNSISMEVQGALK